MYYIKLRTALQKTLWREWKDKPQTGRKYLQITYQIKDLYTEYIKNSWNSVRMHTLKYGQKIWTDISPRKIFRWKINTWNILKIIYLSVQFSSIQFSSSVVSNSLWPPWIPARQATDYSPLGCKELDMTEYTHTLH